MENSTKSLHTYRVIVLCALVILLEGFDLQAAGVSAPRLAPAFHLIPAQMGAFLGASAIGVFLAAVLGGFLADRFGRKLVIVIGVLLFGISSISTLFATGLGMLMLSRFFTGLGLGAAMPVVIALTSDHSPAHLKKRAVGFIYCSIPIGGLLSSVVMMIGAFGNNWKPVYLIGGIAPIIIAPLLAFFLPKEEPVLSKKGTESKASGSNLLSGIFGKGQGSTTISIWMATFLTLLVMYLLLGWMPSLMEAMGLSRQNAQVIQMIYNLGSSAGAALAGYMLDKKFTFSTPITAYIALAVFLSILGFASLNFGLILPVAFVIGLAVTGAQSILYAFAPLCYPAEIRNTGVGATVSFGRLGTIVGPMLAGVLLGGGKTAAQVLIVLIPVTLLGGLFILPVASRIKKSMS